MPANDIPNDVEDYEFLDKTYEECPKTTSEGRICFVFGYLDRVYIPLLMTTVYVNFSTI